MYWRFDLRATDLLDWARWYLRLSSDRDLALALGMAAPTLCRIRSGEIPLGAALMVRLLDVADVRLHDLPRLIDDSSQQWRR
jgi:hypothetical protein